MLVIFQLIVNMFFLVHLSLVSFQVIFHVVFCLLYIFKVQMRLYSFHFTIVLIKTVCGLND